MTSVDREQPLLDSRAVALMDAHAARGSNGASLGAKATVSEGLDSETTCRSVIAGPKALTDAGGGHSAPHADVDPRAPRTGGGSAAMLSPRAQDSRRTTLPADDTEVAPLPTQSPHCHALPTTAAQSLLTAVPDQLGATNPPQAAQQSRAGDAPPSLSTSRQAGVQQLVPPQPQSAPSAGGEAAAALPLLPRLPAVTTASLPPLVEVLAPVALPAASCLIGAVYPIVALRVLITYRKQLLNMLTMLHN